MAHEAAERTREVVRAGVVSILSSVGILAVKFAGWWITDSSALLADALESIVNVVAAALVTYSVAVAARPADDNHPYGHGKAEFLSAAVEGGLILVAAQLIVVESLGKLWAGTPITQLGPGMALGAVGGLANLGLGVFLIRRGRALGSDAIEADGRHVITDVVTTAGSIAALGAVWATGWIWLDPLVGILVAVNIVRTGWQVVRRASSGLLDEADPNSLEGLARALEEARRPDWVDVHQLRTRRAGPLRHIDLHLVVPRFYSVDHAHRVAEEMEGVLTETIGEEVDVVAHVDPCRPWQCVQCSMVPCDLRSEKLDREQPFDVVRITRQGRL